MDCQFYYYETHPNQYSSLPFTEIKLKKLEVFGGHLLSEDDHSRWTSPYWNIMKETFSLGRTEL